MDFNARILTLTVPCRDTDYVLLISPEPAPYEHRSRSPHGRKEFYIRVHDIHYLQFRTHPLLQPLLDDPSPPLCVGIKGYDGLKREIEGLEPDTELGWGYKTVRREGKAVDDWCSGDWDIVGNIIGGVIAEAPGLELDDVGTIWQGILAALREARAATVRTMTAVNSMDFAPLRELSLKARVTRGGFLTASWRVGSVGRFCYVLPGGRGFSWRENSACRRHGRRLRIFALGKWRRGWGVLMSFFLVSPARPTHVRRPARAQWRTDPTRLALFRYRQLIGSSRGDPAISARPPSWGKPQPACPPRPFSSVGPAALHRHPEFVPTFSAIAATMEQYQTTMSAEDRVEQAISACSLEGQCALLVWGDLSQRMTKVGEDGRILFLAFYLWVFHAIRAQGNRCYYQYPYDDFEAALEEGRLPEGLFQAFNAVLVGTKLYHGPALIEELGEAALDPEGNPNAFWAFCRAHRGMTVTFTVAIAMQSDADGAWWMPGPDRFFLEEENWALRLLAVLLPFLRPLGMPDGRRLHLEAQEAALRTTLPDWRPFAGQRITTTMTMPVLELVGHVCEFFLSHYSLPSGLPSRETGEERELTRVLADWKPFEERHAVTEVSQETVANLVACMVYLLLGLHSFISK